MAFCLFIFAIGPFRQITTLQSGFLVNSLEEFAFVIIMGFVQHHSGAEKTKKAETFYRNISMWDISSISHMSYMLEGSNKVMKNFYDYNYHLSSLLIQKIRFYQKFRLFIILFSNYDDNLVIDANTILLFLLNIKMFWNDKMMKFFL